MSDVFKYSDSPNGPWGDDSTLRYVRGVHVFENNRKECSLHLDAIGKPRSRPCELCDLGPCKGEGFGAPVDTVSKIEERTVFVSTDGNHHESMEVACDWQENLEFIEWMRSAYKHDFDTYTPDLVAYAILQNFKVTPK